jgi:outer membrane protein OmpA-like peptidoglycan-associated protein
MRCPLVLVAASLLAPLARADGPLVPLVPGLTIVTAVHTDVGDYESLKTIESVDDNAVKVRLTGDLPVAHPCPTCPKSMRLSGARVILRDDLEHAHAYAPLFHARVTETFNGFTALGTSREVLGELMASGSSKFSWRFVVLGGKFAELQGSLGKLRNLGNKGAAPDPDEKVLHKVDTPAVSVLVNGQRVDLPGVRARGKFDGKTSELTFLADPANPLSLDYDLDQGGHASPLLLGAGGEVTLHVVRIQYPTRDDHVEADLARTGRTELSGIYFDFDSDHLRDESEPVLRTVAAALAAHGEWKLTIEGHTDDIGGVDYNRGLSERRAAAVKQALVSRHGVAEGRLTTQGFGATRPKEPNDTLAGRARNRRVELVRR